MDRTGLRSCPLATFDMRNVKTSVSIVRKIVSQKPRVLCTEANMYKLIPGSCNRGTQTSKHDCLRYLCVIKWDIISSSNFCGWLIMITEHWWCNNRKAEITMLSATLSTKNPIQNILGSKPGLRGEKPPTNRLNCGMAFVSSSELFYRQLDWDIQERLLFKITYEHQYKSNMAFLPFLFAFSL